MCGVRPIAKRRSDALTNMTEVQSDFTSGDISPQQFKSAGLLYVLSGDPQLS